MALSTVQVHALSGGRFTLPETQFVSPASSTARKTVPSLCFLIHHAPPTTGKTTRIVFDLGVRRDPSRYSEPIRRHIATRKPLTTDPDVVKSLKLGGLTPDDVDYVIYSHVHWDHVGEPTDFRRSSFVIPDPEAPYTGRDEAQESGINSRGPWRQFDSLPSTLDIFRDGSLYIVDAPGHLPGHINLLARTSENESDTKWIYLAGDACHDRRLMRHEREVGQWQDA
ncbi:hypothetical protein NW754_009454 [Fusarium falciforme]|nr:hypothetical protein NW754_009454 [Fusarium falciforme]